VEDASLWVLNARDAADKGAVIAPRTRCISGDRNCGLVRPCACAMGGGERSGQDSEIQARSAGQCAGLGSARSLRSALQSPTPPLSERVKGSHIPSGVVSPRPLLHPPKQRRAGVLPVIPFEARLHLIGTTDLDSRRPRAVRVLTKKSSSSCDAASSLLPGASDADQVVGPIPASRPLYDMAASLAQNDPRRRLKLDRSREAPALLSIFGGKITTYRT